MYIYKEIGTVMIKHVMICLYSIWPSFEPVYSKKQSKHLGGKGVLLSQLDLRHSSSEQLVDTAYNRAFLVGWIWVTCRQ